MDKLKCYYTMVNKDCGKLCDCCDEKIIAKLDLAREYFVSLMAMLQGKVELNGDKMFNDIETICSALEIDIDVQNTKLFFETDEVSNG